ncbi:MAG: N-acetylmuramoyl-L-alanine amidase family protein, partial [Planctomycetota bacterium]
MWPRKLVVVVALIAAAVLAGGCGDPDSVHPAHQRLEAPPRTISVFQLAGRLRLRVARNGRSFAQLAGPGNTVSIFPEPTPAVYVNGARLMAPGPIRAADSTIFVAEALAPIVRSALRPAPRPPRRPRREGRRPLGRVVLDAGHGGRDPGAIACTGMFEKDVTLPVTHMVRRRLEAANVRVTLTRADDRFLELDARADIANRAGADLFVSIHADSCPNRRVSGHTLYVARGA